MAATTTTPGSWEDDSLINAVVNAVSEAEGVSPLDLDPLARAVDTETLDSLVTPDTGETVIEFRYSGYEVTVESPDDDPVTIVLSPTS